MCIQLNAHVCLWAPATWPWLKMRIQHGQNFFELVEEPNTTVLFVLREIATVLNKCGMSPCLKPRLKYSLSESCKWASVLMPCFDSLSWSNVKIILLKTWHFPRNYSTWYWAFNYHKLISEFHRIRWKLSCKNLKRTTLKTWHFLRHNMIVSFPFF